MEVQRLCSVLDKHLANSEYLVGSEYTIADMVVFPWFNQLQVGYKHTSGVAAADFLDIAQYTNAIAWAEKLRARPAVQRGLQVCGFSGVAKPWLTEEKKA
jgi:GSH-dependent disulfide-bond oxidoreductase